MISTLTATTIRNILGSMTSLAAKASHTQRANPSTALLKSQITGAVPALERLALIE